MRPWALGILLAFLAGLGLGLWFDHAPAAGHGTELQEVRLPSGAVALHQNPGGPPPSIGPVPATWKVRTVAQVELQDVKPIAAGEVQIVTVAQVDTKEGPRIVVKGQDGQVIGGAAWDVGPSAPEYHWSLQAIREQDWTGRGSWGAELANYHGRLVTSVTVTGSGIHAGFGVRW